MYILWAKIYLHNRVLYMEKPPVLLIPAVLNRQDPSIVLAAVSQDPSAIEFASQSLVSQQDFLCLGALGWFFQWGFLKSWGFPKHEGVYFMENHMKILWRFIYWCLCHGESYENHWKWIWFRGTPPILGHLHCFWYSLVNSRFANWKITIWFLTS